MNARYYTLAALGLLMLTGGAAQAQIPLQNTNFGSLTHTDGYDTVRVGSHRKVYTGFLQAGKTYTFDLKSTKFDPFLRIETMGGMQVAANDDGGAGLNSRITFTPMFSASYKIIVTSFAKEKTGSYVLTYSSFGGGGGPGPGVLWLHPGNNFGTLSHLDPFDKIRTQSHAKTYRVSMTAGNTYVLTMESAQFDTFLRLETMAGQVLKVDDDSGQGLNARIVFTPNVSGTYRVIATSFAADKTGNFVIKMGVLAGPIAAQTIHGALTFADAVDFQGRRFDSHAKFLQAGKTYTISMNSPTFDTLLKVKNGVGIVVASNDDGGAGLNSKLTFTPFASGMYQIVATSFSPARTGHYTITIVQ
jgi:hypothetical protein